MALTFGAPPALPQSRYDAVPALTTRRRSMASSRSRSLRSRSSRRERSLAMSSASCLSSCVARRSCSAASLAEACSAASLAVACAGSAPACSGPAAKPPAKSRTSSWTGFHRLLRPRSRSKRSGTAASAWQTNWISVLGCWPSGDTFAPRGHSTCNVHCLASPAPARQIKTETRKRSSAKGRASTSDASKSATSDSSARPLTTRPRARSRVTSPWRRVCHLPRLAAQRCMASSES
mmetsp:Transcript_156783/g.380803  ORF Transcript_156783/g.380803 Transcript_156783/m.380803 type:complete len:235 (-) Transcript_156783:276-980(-)